MKIMSNHKMLVCEAVGALRVASRAIQSAVDNVGDAAVDTRSDAKVLEALQDRLVGIEHSLSVFIDDLRKANEVQP